MSQKDGAPKKRPNPFTRLEIRRELCRQVARGQNVTTIAEALVAKYGKHFRLTVRGIQKDWQRRDIWLPLIVLTEKPEELIQMFALDMQEARVEAWGLYTKALKSNQFSAAVGALKIIGDHWNNQIELLQSLGKLHKSTTKVEGVEGGAPIVFKIYKPEFKKGEVTPQNGESRTS